jgi:hypothetical protein
MEPMKLKEVFTLNYWISRPTPELTGRAHNTAKDDSTMKAKLTRAPVE